MGGRTTRAQKHQSPRSLWLCGGLLLGNRSGRRFGLMLSHRVLPAPLVPSQVSQPTFQGLFIPSEFRLGRCATPASDSVALSTGCFRAHTWRCQTSERRLPCFQVSGTPLRVSPSAGFPASTPGLATQRPVHLPGELPYLLRGLAPYPGRGAFRCRSIGAFWQRRTLTRPVHPLRILKSASGGLRLLRHFPPWHSPLLAIARYETPRPISVGPTGRMLLRASGYLSDIATEYSIADSNHPHLAVTLLSIRRSLSEAARLSRTG